MKKWLGYKEEDTVQKKVDKIKEFVVNRFFKSSTPESSAVWGMKDLLFILKNLEHPRNVVLLRIECPMNFALLALSLLHHRNKEHSFMFFVTKNEEYVKRILNTQLCVKNCYISTVTEPSNAYTDLNSIRFGDDSKKAKIVLISPEALIRAHEKSRELNKKTFYWECSPLVVIDNYSHNERNMELLREFRRKQSRAPERLWVLGWPHRVNDLSVFRSRE